MRDFLSNEIESKRSWVNWKLVEMKIIKDMVVPTEPHELQSISDSTIPLPSEFIQLISSPKCFLISKGMSIVCRCDSWVSLARPQFRFWLSWRYPVSRIVLPQWAVGANGRITLDPAIDSSRKANFPCRHTSICATGRRRRITLQSTRILT